MTAPETFGAVIVNFRAAGLAIGAARSFLGDGGARAIVVDNRSPDDSWALFRAFAGGGPAPDAPRPSPIVNRPPTYADLAPDEIACVEDVDAARATPASVRLVFIKSAANGGFAAGCNLGLAALDGLVGVDALLLLNPDAALARGALRAFAERLADPGVGLCGASVVGFEAPHRAQAFGGAAMDALHRGFNIGEGATLDDRPSRAEVEARLAYPLGAAMACRADYLDVAGYLDERYFLYFEEADWTRAGLPARKPAWAPDAIVHHRYGASSASAKRRVGEPSARSPLSDYHMTRSRILFARKWRPLSAPIARAAGAWQAAQRFARGRPANARAVAAAAARPDLPGPRP